MITKMNENKYVIIVSILSIIAMISIIGYTYSFFQVTVTNNTVIAGQTESLKLDLSVSKVLPNNSEDLIPQLDTAITKAVIGAAGIIYAIVLGVNYIKAETPDKRKEAQSRLINAIVGVIIIIAGVVICRVVDWDGLLDMFNNVTTTTK